MRDTEINSTNELNTVDADLCRCEPMPVADKVAGEKKPRDEPGKEPDTDIPHIPKRIRKNKALSEPGEHEQQLSSVKEIAKREEYLTRRLAEFDKERGAIVKELEVLCIKRLQLPTDKKGKTRKKQESKKASKRIAENEEGEEDSALPGCEEDKPNGGTGKSKQSRGKRKRTSVFENYLVGV